ncbi:MAG TPA: Ig-like domain-containing protein [Gemmatimonadales bacterium]|nr:Ig-like domain-containing protein [Gemmatimonadales bacterium]
MHWNLLCRSLSFLGAAALAIGCSSDPSAPAPVRTPTAMGIAYGNDQVGVAGRPLVQNITVKVIDQQDKPMRDVSVSFAVTGGGGSVDAPTDVTDNQGFASTAWTLGSGPGVGAQSATATIDGAAIAPVTFTARVVTEVVRGAGDGQMAEVGHAVGEAPTVIIRDAAGEPVAGMAVLWTVTSGGGWVDSPSSFTDVNGVASMPWTLGYSVGSAQALQASLSPSVATTFTASAVLTSASMYVQAGDHQTGVAGADLALPVMVRVTTEETEYYYGHAVEGVEVHWEVVGGGGSTRASTSLTNASGLASVTWVLGDSLGTDNQRLQASVTGLVGPPVEFTATATAGP